MIEDPDSGESLTAEEPEGFTQVPDSLLLNTSISDGAYRLYAVLKHHARARNTAYPGRKRLASELGVRSPRTVDSRLKELRDAGYLVVRPRYRDSGGQTSNHYHLLFYPRPPATEPREGAASPTKDGGPAADKDAVGHGTRPVDNSLRDPSQNSAHRDRLRGAGADSCAGSAQESARERSTPSLSTRSLKTDGAPSPDPVASQVANQAPRQVASSVATEARNPGDPGEGEGTAATGARLDASADAEVAEWAQQVVAALPAQLYPSTRAQYHQMTELFESHVELAGQRPETLVAQLIGNRPLPEVVTHPVGLLRARLDGLPPVRRVPSQSRPAWCGECDEQTRCHWDQESDKIFRCRACHPHSAAATAADHPKDGAR